VSVRFRRYRGASPGGARGADRGGDGTRILSDSGDVAGSRSRRAAARVKSIGSGVPAPPRVHSHGFGRPTATLGRHAGARLRLGRRALRARRASRAGQREGGEDRGDRRWSKKPAVQLLAIEHTVTPGRAPRPREERALSLYLPGEERTRNIFASARTPERGAASSARGGRLRPGCNDEIAGHLRARQRAGGPR